MSDRPMSIALPALMLVIIGGWFIITSLLPLLGVETGYYSITTQGAVFYLYFSLEDIGESIKLLTWLFPFLGVLGFVVGFSLFGGNGRIFGKIAFMVTLALSVLALMVCFAFMGIDTATGYWEYLKNAFTSGDIVGSLGVLLEPLLIIAASIIGQIMLSLKSAKEFCKNN